jgi:hypothetical protein
MTYLPIVLAALAVTVAHCRPAQKSPATAKESPSMRTVEYPGDLAINHSIPQGGKHLRPEALVFSPPLKVEIGERRFEVEDKPVVQKDLIMAGATLSNPTDKPVQVVGDLPPGAEDRFPGPSHAAGSEYASAAAAGSAASLPGHLAGAHHGEVHRLGAPGRIRL